MNTNEINKILCPVCGKEAVREYDICPVCNWENDLIQLERPDLGGGANAMSLNEAREAYLKGVPVK
ncbi:MAG: cysteine-rich CPCC protein [Chaetfec virus UA24_244]|nr:MAG: cysteine-rich CPCC protein [Chaetfec virus UA24_244]